MVNVRLIEVSVEQRRKGLGFSKFGTAGTRWCATVALSLYDEESKHPVAEWFYLMVCSGSYLKRPLIGVPVWDEKYLFIQDAFDLGEIEVEARRRLANVHAKDWQDFYSQMKGYFLHED